MPFRSVILLSLVVGGCAASPVSPPFAPPAATIPGARHPLAEAEAIKAKSRDDLGRVVGEPLERFKAERPKSCQSKTLQEARSAALYAMNLVTVQTHGAEAVLASGVWYLNVGDEAKKAGCKAIARAVYDTVVEHFTGAYYAALRQRAEIGIADLRTH